MSRRRTGTSPGPKTFRPPVVLAVASLTLLLAIPAGGWISGYGGSSGAAATVPGIGPDPLGPARTSTGAGGPSPDGALAAARAVAPARPDVLVSSTIDLVGNNVSSGNVATRYANEPDGIAYDPAEDLVFVAGSQSNSVLAIDPSSGVTQVVAGPFNTTNASAINGAPAGLAFDSVDSKLFASDPPLDQIEVFNVSTTSPSFSYSMAIQLSPGTHPEGLLALTHPDEVFVADEDLDLVTALNGATGAIVGNVTVGGGPIALTYDPTQDLVYVADSATADVFWFAPLSLNPGATNFPVRNDPTQIAYDPDDDTIWIANTQVITVLDSATQNSSINLTFASGSRIQGLLWDPILSEMVVANLPGGAISYLNSSGSITGNVTTGGAPAAMIENTQLEEVDAIDASGNNLIRISDLSVGVVGTDILGSTPGLSTFDPVTDRIEVPDTTSNRVLEVNTKAVSGGDQPRVRSLLVPGHPVAAAFDPVTGEVVVALVDSVIVGLNATSGAIVQTDNLGGGNTPYDVMFADDQVFVTGGANLLWALNPTTLAVTSAIQLTSLASSPRLMAYDASTQLLYVTLETDNELAVVNATRGAVAGTIAAGTEPYGIAYDPTNGNLFVSDFGAAAVNVINAASGNSLDLVGVGTDPSDVLYVPGVQEVYEADTRSNTVTVLDANSFTEVSTVPVGDYPDALVLANVTGDVFVSNAPDSSLSVILASAAGPVPFQVGLSVLPTHTDVGTSVTFTASASYPAWDYSYRYTALPDGCTSENFSVFRCQTTGSAENLNTSVRVTSEGGDSANATAALSLISGVSVASFTVSRSTITIGIPVTFNVLAQGGLPPYTYSYPALPPGCPAVTTDQFTCTPNKAGGYTPEVLVVDQAKLPATMNVNLTVNLPMVSNPTVSESSIVLGQTVTIAANVTQGTPPYSFSYTGLPPGCTTANASSVACEPTGTGSYSITVHIVDASGSPSTQKVSLVVNAPASTSAGPPLLEYLVIGLAIAAVAIVAVVLVRRKGPRPSTGPPEEPTEGGGAGPDVYSTSSRAVPRLPVGPADAHGPETDTTTPQYFVPSPEEGTAAAAMPSSGSPAGGARANLVCPSCGTVNEPWLTYCRSCKRPLLST